MDSEDDVHYHLARLAVDKAKLCIVNLNSSNPQPRVGVVVAKRGVLLGWAAKGVGGQYFADGEFHEFEVPPQDHAEQAILAKLHPDDLAGASVYVTLEPCTKRNKGASCMEQLVAAGVAEVHVANCDPNPDIAALAWREFHKHGIKVRDFPGDLRNEARRDNFAFFKKFVWSARETGSAAFDYEANGGLRTLGPVGYEFRTRWTNRGRGSIYAIDNENNVCLAKHCSAFEEVDDPGRWLEDAYYTKPVDEGEIVIFRNQHGYALVKVVYVTPKTTTSNAELRFAYQLRYRQ